MRADGCDDWIIIIIFIQTRGLQEVRKVVSVVVVWWSGHFENGLDRLYVWKIIADMKDEEAFILELDLDTEGHNHLNLLE